jgi:isopentenyl-diphosphate delta-isomerase
MKTRSSKLLAKRKNDHLELCSHQNVSSLNTAGWEDILLPHCALPELDMNEVSLESKFLGFKFKAPFLISSMTGGTAAGEKLNLRLAEFAENFGLAMGVGSQRIQAESRNKKIFQIRKKAPNAIIWANIGAVQLNYKVGIDDCRWLVDQIQAQALILHCNPLQEAIQSEGDRNFKGLFKKIEELKKHLSVPLILKETGCGLDVNSSKRALSCGIDALDIAGLGGTHWGFIEGLRDKSRLHLGQEFRNWGIPSAKALIDLRSALGPQVPLIASGGLRNGLDAAKALYLGADLCGMAQPFLKAAQKSEKALEKLLLECSEALRIALFCTGSSSPLELKTKGNEK